MQHLFAHTTYITYVAIVYTENNIVNKFIRVRCDI